MTLEGGGKTGWKQVNSAFYAQLKPDIKAKQEGKKKFCVSTGVIVLEKYNSRCKPYYQVLEHEHCKFNPRQLPYPTLYVGIINQDQFSRRLASNANA